MGKNQENEDINQCMKEGMHQVCQLIEYWSEDSSIAGVIDMNGNTRREDYGEIKEWMYPPRVIGKYTKRTQIFFKVQTKLSVIELVKNQEEYWKKYNLGLTTKGTNLVHTQKIGYIAGANVKLSSEKWY